MTRLGTSTPPMSQIQELQSRPQGFNVNKVAWDSHAPDQRDARPHRCVVAGSPANSSQ